MLAWTSASADEAKLRILVLFGINICLHMLWSPLFFNLERPDCALIEVPFLWLSIVALMFGVAQLSVLPIWLLVPYLLGVTFAALSQFDDRAAGPAVRAAYLNLNPHRIEDAKTLYRGRNALHKEYFGQD